MKIYSFTLVFRSSVSFKFLQILLQFPSALFCLTNACHLARGVFVASSFEILIEFHIRSSSFCNQSKCDKVKTFCLFSLHSPVLVRLPWRWILQGN